MESQSAVSHVEQDTNMKGNATTLGRIPVVDPEPHSPCSLTFKAQNSETTVVDHSSHNVDMPTKGHFQETGQPRWAKLRVWRKPGIQPEELKGK